MSVKGNGRAIHLLDLENLVGTGRPTAAMITDAARAYAEVVRVGATDHFVLGCGSSTAFSAFFAWPWPSRRVLGSGQDGADLALLDVLMTEDLSGRYERIYVGSGDHAFEPAVRALVGAGVDVKVVARPSSLAMSLWSMGRTIDFPDTTSMQESA